jgi:hypothetical protein
MKRVTDLFIRESKPFSPIYLPRHQLRHAQTYASEKCPHKSLLETDEMLLPLPSLTIMIALLYESYLIVSYKGQHAT